MSYTYRLDDLVTAKSESSPRIIKSSTELGMRILYCFFNTLPAVTTLN